jgi:ATP-dependent protease ClpP protease subunit
MEAVCGAKGLVVLKVADVLLAAEELRFKNELLAAILARHSSAGLSLAAVLELVADDNYMTPEEAVARGLIDAVQPALGAAARAEPAPPPTKQTQTD